MYPQTELGSDPSWVKDYAQTVEDLGFSHIIAYDHILGANPERAGGWHGAYTYQSAFLEPFVLFSYLAAFTQRLQLTPGILVLPQRQTALVAKQAATLDVLSLGRLRLGIGLGWNEVEYIALGEDFHTRGKRIEEQVDLLRQLWTQPLVTYQGKWHMVPDAGLNPLPIQQPIPIWFGGSAPPALRRLARMADGWLVNIREPEEAQPAFDLLSEELDRLGRKRDEFGIEARIHHGGSKPEQWVKSFEKWEAMGVTHVSFNTMNARLNGPDTHLEEVRRFAQAVGIKPA